MSQIPNNVQNTRALGQVLYTNYVLLFQLAGLILLVAMIGAIVLTHRDRHIARRQNITQQQSRTLADTLVMVDAPLGEGVTAILRRKPRVLVGHGHESDDTGGHDHGHPDDSHEPVHGVGHPGPGEHG